MKLRAVIFLLSMLIVGCTSTRWVVDDEYAVDEEEGEVISSRSILQKAAGPEMDQPVLSLELYEVQEVAYPERLLARRYVQQYRPRYGIWALGLGTSAIMLGMANTDMIVDLNLTRNEQILMNSSAAVVGAASLLSMRPVGDLMDTGAERLLSEVGTTVRKDTVRLHNDEHQSINVHIYDDEMIHETETEFPIMAGSVDINLLAELGIESIERDDPGSIHVTFEFEDKEYVYRFDTKDFMGRFAEITEENAPLRSGPNLISGNIITNLSSGNQLAVLEEYNSDWVQVDFGVSSGYVHSNDSRLIWQPRYAAQDEVALESAGEFGELEIENEIPEAGFNNENTVAIIWVNDNYDNEQIHQIPNLERSTELAQTYMQRRLGVPEEQIHTYRNTGYDEITSEFDTDSLYIAGQEIEPGDTNLIIYYLGHGLTDNGNNGGRGYLLPADFNPKEPEARRVELRQWLNSIAKVQTNTTSVILDTDFMGSSVSEELEHLDRYGNELLLQEETRDIVDQHSNAAVLFASEAGQLNGRYISEDGRTNNFHGIFTYYFFRALRDDADMAALFRSLERNVTFTSRRIHDRAQDPVIFGESAVRLLNQPENDD